MPRGRLAWRLRAVRARTRGSVLRTTLARGADPWESADLMICAARLTSPTTRGALADSIDVLVRLAQFGPFFPSVRRHREVLLAERRTLAQITRHLRAPAPVSPEGAARLADFLWSRSSPLFNDVAASVIQATIARSAETLAAATPQR